MKEDINEVNRPHLHFTSASVLADWFTHKRSVNGNLSGYGTSDSHAHTEQGVTDLREGTLENLDKAQAIVDELSLSIDTQTTTWQMDIQGAYPDVPTFLTGVPENMWNMVPDLSDKTPLVVWIGLTSQAGISHDTLMRRGATLAAFVLAMSNMRSVVLRPYVALGGSGYSERRSRRRTEGTELPDSAFDNLPDDGERAIIISWDIQTSPMVLSELMTLARPEVTRYFGIEACQQAFGRVATHDGRFHPDSFVERTMKDALGVGDSDLYLPQITSIDPMITNPVEWVRENVSKFTGAQSGDTSATTDYMSERDLEAYRRGYYA